MSDSRSKYEEILNKDFQYHKADKEVAYEEKDSIVESVLNKYQERSEVGIKKYGVTMDREDLSFLEWMNHLQQELMDATLYVEKMIRKHERA